MPSKFYPILVLLGMCVVIAKAQTTTGLMDPANPRMHEQATEHVKDTSGSDHGFWAGAGIGIQAVDAPFTDRRVISLNFEYLFRGWFSLTSDISFFKDFERELKGASTWSIAAKIRWRISPASIFLQAGPGLTGPSLGPYMAHWGVGADFTVLGNYSLNMIVMKTTLEDSEPLLLLRARIRL